MRKFRWFWRCGLYCVDLLVLICGITLHTKTLLVASPSYPSPTACPCSGAGVCLTVNMELTPNPADGLVSSLSQATGQSLGLCKTLFDVTCVGVTAALSLLLGEQVIGIGADTVATMLLTGPGHRRNQSEVPTAHAAAGRAGAPTIGPIIGGGACTQAEPLPPSRTAEPSAGRHQI